MKKFYLLVLVLALITIFMPQPNDAAATNDIKVSVNDKLIDFPDQKPFIDNSRTFVPLRFVSEALGGEVDWDSDAQTAIVEREGTYIEMKIGSTKPLVKDETKTLDAPARLANQRTMVPLRFVSEALGEYVDWDGNTRTVYISNVPREVDNEDTPDYSNAPANTDNIEKMHDGGGGRNTTPATDSGYVPWEQLNQQ